MEMGFDIVGQPGVCSSSWLTPGNAYASLYIAPSRGDAIEDNAKYLQFVHGE
jgi:hypothetical protein